MGRKAAPVKLCLKCHRTLPLSSFYPNRQWEEQNFCDIYCRECARAMVKDKDTVRKYLWENNRLWMDKMWISSERKAMALLQNNQEWLSKKTSAKKKEEMQNKCTAEQALVCMNLSQYYSFVPHQDDGSMREFDPDSQDGMLVPTENGETVLDDGARIYSARWNGMYTKREIEYLDNYYARLEEGFVLDDINIQDYASKVARSSLMADSKYNDYRLGRCSLREWQDAQSTFDSLSKSAAFAACQKKDKNNNSDMVLCEIIQDIEVNHHARMPQTRFPADDIDAILADFAHTDVAIK